MKFSKIFKSEATNPDTGAIVAGIRAKSDNGKVYKVLNSMAELQAHGTVEKVLADLIVKDGQYGDYAQLPRYTELEAITW